MRLTESDIAKYPALTENPLSGTQLYEHQKLLVSACMKHELTQRTANGHITNFGFIADETGAGKTICAISITTLLNRMQVKARLKKEILPFDKGVVKHYSPKNEDYVQIPPEHRRKTLIIVPVGLGDQWDREITKFALIPHIYLQNIKHVRAFNLADDGPDSPEIVLCKAGALKHLIQIGGARSYMFDRVFIDECDSINISNFPDLNAMFFWFVSATADTLRSDGLTLSCKNIGFVRNTYNQTVNVHIAEDVHCDRCIRKFVEHKEIIKKLREATCPYSHCYICWIVAEIAMSKQQSYQDHPGCRVPICCYAHDRQGRCVINQVREVLRKKRFVSIMDGTFRCDDDILNHFKMNMCHGCDIKLRETQVNTLLDMCMFRNDPEFVVKCLTLDAPNTRIVLCKTPHYIKVANQVSGVISADIVRIINSGDIAGAAEQYGINIKSGENIITGIKRDIEKRIAAAQSVIAKEMSLHTSVSDKLNALKEVYKTTETEEIKEHKRELVNISNRVKTQEARIKTLTDRLNSLVATIQSLGDENCGICIDKVAIPTMVQCCKTVFCLSCISSWLNEYKNDTCPFCRQGLTMRHLDTIVNKQLVVDSPGEPPTKEMVLMDVLRMSSASKILIFTERDESINLIEEVLLKMGTSYICYRRSNTGFTNIVNYLEGPVRVVVLNSVSHGAGLNMQNTTDVVLYHKMAADLEKQAIGRAQRPGRKNKLRIWRLAYDGEYDSSEIAAIQQSSPQETASS